ncbi:ABC transporter ATP-binding protein [Bradyrhizobium sp. DASA03007]|uniref:ABC transporter ATP-binding protein n=1 Tax=unclassified Bradyrhizobium TaxID=2631580 RepID=UPI003F6F27A8
MVFQNYALFPHMTVAENVAFPLEMRNAPRNEVLNRVTEALSLVALEKLADRLPRQLSGGQQQRVALARAFVFQPKLLLLDEPLGALDRKLREQIQLEVRRLQQRLGLTAVFVTHDQEEALILSDRIAVMNRGRIQQIGTPTEIYAKPSNRFVADFIGESCLFEATPAEANTALINGKVLIAHSGALQDWTSVMIRPERVRLASANDTFENTFEGYVTELVYLGDSVRLRIDTDDELSLLARWQTGDISSVPAMGDRTRIGFRREDVQLVGGET